MNNATLMECANEYGVVDRTAYEAAKNAIQARKVELCIEYGTPYVPFKRTRWAEIAHLMDEGDSYIVQNQNEAYGLAYALKRIGKGSQKEYLAPKKLGGKVRVHCVELKSEVTK